MKLKFKGFYGNINHAFNKAWTDGQGLSTINTKGHKKELPCEASAGKAYRCRLISTNVSKSTPYKMTRVVTDYSGNKSISTVTSKFYEYVSNEIESERCCYKGCEFMDKKCLNYNSEICPNLKIEEGQENKDMIRLNNDPVLVSKIKIISSNYYYNKCPIGYTVFKEGCYEAGCDLNQGAGGEYTYFCYKKQKLSEFKDELPINVFYVSINNQECAIGFIKGEHDLNADAGGDSLTLCYGYDKNSSLSPISDFYINVVGWNTPPRDFECDKTDLNLRSGGKDIFICYKRDTTAPKKIIIHDLKFDLNKIKKFSSLGKLKNSMTVKIDSNGYTGSFFEKKTVTTSMSKIWETGNAVEVQLGYTNEKSDSDDKFTFDVSVKNKFEWNSKLTHEWKNTKEENATSEFSCNAPENKKVKCDIFNFETTSEVPYSGKIIYENYSSEKQTVDLIGWLERVETSSFSIKTCCLEGCCTGNKLEDLDKPQCKEGIKDILCKDFEKCFE